MRRGDKPTKAQAKAKRAAVRRPAKTSTSRLGQIEQQLAEARAQQAATGEILKLIASAPADAQPVFDVLARSARQLCDGEFCFVLRFDGEHLHFAACHGLTPERLAAFREALPRPAGEDTAAGRAVLRGAAIQIPDAQEDPAYGALGVARAVTYRSLVAVPMLRDGRAIGAIVVARSPAGLFPDRQVELLQTFADEAVIAIENARLIQELAGRNGELTESLEQQTATGEILRVISNSPTDVQPVFDAVAASAARLCEVSDVIMFRREGDGLRMVAHHGPIPAVQPTVPLARGTGNGRAVLDAQTVHVTDMQAEVDEFPEGSANARLMGHRAILCVPLMRDGVALGTIHLRDTEARRFTDRQVALLQTFADQAVIAIENVRLFQELEARNRELTQALEQQTATSEILGVISSSPTDVQPVFDAIAESSRRLATPSTPPSSDSMEPSSTLWPTKA